MIREELSTRLTRVGINFNQELLDRLNIFYEILTLWSKTHNLTGDSSKEAIINNIIDSLYPVKFVKEPKNLLDVGSGAGYPGLILASYWNTSSVSLVEPRAKRASFLRLASIKMGLKSVEVHRLRVEELRGLEFELITSRAVGDIKLLLDLTKNITSKSSRYLFYKGSRVDKEILNLPNYNIEITPFGSRRYLYLTPKGS